ncbi:3-hydroxyacyl-CoA dehydrogenase, partial [Glutamicibacter soli]|nr:3-hydroxyacyl-CoA dehydrogenase [Glutamicibacter soli]
RTGDLTVLTDQTALDAARRRVTGAGMAHLNAPRRIVEAVAASPLPLTQGLTEERRLYLECQNDPQRAALVHAFFAERVVAKFPEQQAKARPLRRIGVIGGGTMGSGIATACLLAGFQVTLVEQTDQALDRGLSTVSANLDGALKRGKLRPQDERETRAALTGAT